MDNMETSLKDKVEDLINFCEAVKFGMMTTRQPGTGLLVSRCMATAAKVRLRRRHQEAGANGYRKMV